jgi:hypothetical protein
MPAIRCRCGESLRYGEIPNPIEWLLIADQEYDKYQGAIDAEALYQAMRNMLKCPKCARLWVFWDGFGSSPVSYAEEQP